MTLRARYLLGVLGTCSALGLAACGASEEPKGDPLPADAVATLQQRLDEIERRYQDAVDNANVGACNDIGSDSLPAIQDVIAGLPQGVDAELRTAVDRSFARLAELTDADCADIEPEPEPDPEPVPAPDPVPEPVPETVPEETTPQETAPDEQTTPEPAPDSGGKPAKPEKPPKGGGIEVPPGLEGHG